MKDMLSATCCEWVCDRDRATADEPLEQQARRSRRIAKEQQQ
jgi:hypothetical protein